MVGVHLLTVEGEPVLPPHQGQLPVTTVAPSSTAPSAGGCVIQSTATMANMKEKTPMCLINELARFNKVRHNTHSFFFSTFTFVSPLNSVE